MLCTTELEDVLFFRDHKTYAAFKRSIQHLRSDEIAYFAARDAYLTEHIGNKAGLLARIDDYAAHGGPDELEFAPLNRDDISQAFEYGSAAAGEQRACMCEAMAQGWAAHLLDYGKAVNRADDETIVELGTGAGLGTWAALQFLRPGSYFLSVDFDYLCIKNCDALAKHFGLENRAAGILANCWRLPFADSIADAVCTHYALDEMREVPAALAEISRVLRSVGRFVITTRVNPSDRYGDVLTLFGVDEKECLPLLQRARLMCGPEILTDWAAACGLALLSRRDYAPAGSHARALMVFEKM